jgi:UDP-glucose 4-epimerase
MKIFVTGAAGFIGSVVTERLLNLGHSVLVFDSLKYGHRAAVHEGAEFVEGDLRDAKLVFETLKSFEAEAVVHLAAEAYIDDSVVDPGIFFDVNTSAGLHMLMSMRDLGIRKMVFSSTSATYGEPKSIPVRESDPQDPVNAYGESKLQFEKTMTWFHKAHGLNHVSLRYFNACGASKRFGEDRKKETHIIPILFEVVEGRRKEFTLFGNDYPTPDGTCIRDYVHVEDIADAHILALEKIDQLGERAYNLGSGSGYSNLQVIEAARKVTGHPIEFQVGPRRVGDPARLVASHEKITAELGWRPQWTDLEKMIESSWVWRQKHKGAMATR